MVVVVVVVLLLPYRGAEELALRNRFNGLGRFALPNRLLEPKFDLPLGAVVVSSFVAKRVVGKGVVVTVVVVRAGVIEGVVVVGLKVAAKVVDERVEETGVADRASFFSLISTLFKLPSMLE